MLDWLTVTAFVLGAGVGAFAMYLLRHRFNDTQVLRRQLSELRAEMESYRTQVDEHFERTSDLFQKVTRNYRSLHDHLAEGATGLTRGARRLPSIELPEKALLEARPDPAESAVASNQSPETGVGNAADIGDSQHDVAERTDAGQAPEADREVSDTDNADTVADGAGTVKQ